jgi:hypothetical protein
MFFFAFFGLDNGELFHPAKLDDAVIRFYVEMGWQAIRRL